MQIFYLEEIPLNTCYITHGYYKPKELDLSIINNIRNLHGVPIYEDDYNIICIKGTSEELKVIVDKIKEQEKMDFLEETTAEKILSFEKEKGITLPSKYKEWLLFSDGGELFLPAGVQFYGIEHKPVIDVNDNSIPSDDYVVIGALASGDPILFEKNGEKIAIYNQAAGRIEDDEIYDDFIAFLTDLYDLLGIGG